MGPHTPKSEIPKLAMLNFIYIFRCNGQSELDPSDGGNSSTLHGQRLALQVPPQIFFNYFDYESVIHNGYGGTPSDFIHTGVFPRITLTSKDGCHVSIHLLLYHHLSSHPSATSSTMSSITSSILSPLTS